MRKCLVLLYAKALPGIQKEAREQNSFYQKQLFSSLILFVLLITPTFARISVEVPGSEITDIC